MQIFTDYEVTVCHNLQTLQKYQIQFQTTKF